MAKWKKFKGVKLPKVNNRFISQGTSKEELEVANFLQLEIPRHKVYRGDRVVLQGREIDIYVPALKFGIEFHGLFFHKDKDRLYHLNKAILAEQAGVYLIQIFEDEWTNHRALVCDLIRKALGKYQTLKSSDCYLTPVPEREAQKFFEKTHLLGPIEEPAKYYFGAYYQNSLVYCCAIADRQTFWEILRDSSLPGITVNGGLKDCLALLPNKRKTLIQLDRRLYDGKQYLEMGFEPCGFTEPNNYYSADFTQRFTETQRLKQPLKQNEEWYTYYDAGNRKLVLN